MQFKEASVAWHFVPSSLIHLLWIWKSSELLQNKCIIYHSSPENKQKNVSANRFGSKMLIDFTIMETPSQWRDTPFSVAWHVWYPHVRSEDGCGSRSPLAQDHQELQEYLRPGSQGRPPWSATYTTRHW